MDPKAAFYVPDMFPAPFIPLYKSTLLSDARISLIFLVVQVCTCPWLPLGFLGLKKVISPLLKGILLGKKYSYLYFKNVALAHDDSDKEDFCRFSSLGLWFRICRVNLEAFSNQVLGVASIVSSS